VPTPTPLKGDEAAAQESLEAALAAQRALGNNQVSTGLNADR
jgi:hypothetical protein